MKTILNKIMIVLISIVQINAKAFEQTFCYENDSLPTFKIIYYGNPNNNLQNEINRYVLERNSENKYEYIFINSNSDSINTNVIEVISPNGNQIFELTDVSLTDIDLVFNKIKIRDSLLTLYGVSSLEINSFKPTVSKFDGVSFYEGGIFGNYIKHSYFTNNDKFSVIIHTIPNCAPCIRLKRSIEEHVYLFEEVNFYYLNHAFDDNGKQYSMREMNDSPEFRAFVADFGEGRILFPLIWIVDSEGKIKMVISNYNEKEEKMSLMEFLVSNLNNYITVIPKDITLSDTSILENKLPYHSDAELICEKPLIKLSENKVYVDFQNMSLNEVTIKINIIIPNLFDKEKILNIINKKENGLNQKELIYDLQDSNNFTKNQNKIIRIDVEIYNNSNIEVIKKSLSP